MSRHNRISCDSCSKENFRGKRYKCLICHDYDLCEVCYTSNASTINHTSEHPMQCILTRNDCEIYYAGELTIQFSQSFTCPYCGEKGFTELDLADHVTNTHGPLGIEVICPICAASPLARSNVIREDFIGHLTLDHRIPSRDFVSFFDEIPRQGVRRIPMSNSRLTSARGARRTQGSAAVAVPLDRPLRNRYTDRVAKRTIGITPHRIIPPDEEESETSMTSQQILSHNNELILPDCLSTHLPDLEQVTLEEERANKGLFVSRLVLSTLEQDVSELCDKMKGSFLAN